MMCSLTPHRTYKYIYMCNECRKFILSFYCLLVILKYYAILRAPRTGILFVSVSSPPRVPLLLRACHPSQEVEKENRFLIFDFIVTIYTSIHTHYTSTLHRTFSVYFIFKQYRREQVAW